MEEQPDQKQKKKIKAIEYNVFQKMPQSIRKHRNYFETPQLKIFRSQIQKINLKFIIEESSPPQKKTLIKVLGAQLSGQV